MTLKVHQSTLEAVQQSREKKRKKTELPLPEYFSAAGMMRDPAWVESYLSIVLQWPKTCTIKIEDRQIIGLAKSLAFMWEPGILNHTDLALETGSLPEQITEAIKTTAATLGLAYLDRAVRPEGTATKLDAKTKGVLASVQEYFGRIPECFRRKIVVEDRDWLKDLLVVSLPSYDSSPEILEPRLRAFVSLASASVMGWDEGIRMYGKAALKFRATNREVHDVIKSAFKTSVSNSMAAGFRVPCHIPSLENYRTILSAYVENGAITKRRISDRLSSRSSRPVE